MIINPYLKINGYANEFELVRITPGKLSEDKILGKYSYESDSLDKCAATINTVIAAENHGPILTVAQTENLILNTRLEYLREHIIAQIVKLELEDIDLITKRLQKIVRARQAEIEDKVVDLIYDLLDVDYPYVCTEAIMAKLAKKLNPYDF